jgi:hypothetical protein
LPCNFHARGNSSICRLDSDGSLAKTNSNVGVLSGIVSRWEVVAHSEVWSDIRPGILQSGTLDRGATNLLGASPGNLREVSPTFEIGHAWAGLTVETFVIRGFVVVHAIGDEGRDLTTWSTSADVLAVSLVVAVQRLVSRATRYVSGGSLKLRESLRVMGVNTRVGDLQSSCGKLIRPSQWVGVSVVGAMDVVLVQDLLSVVTEVAHNRGG